MPSGPSKAHVAMQQPACCCCIGVAHGRLQALVRLGAWWLVLPVSSDAPLRSGLSAQQIARQRPPGHGSWNRHGTYGSHACTCTIYIYIYIYRLAASTSPSPRHSNVQLAQLRARDVTPATCGRRSRFCGVRSTLTASRHEQVIGESRGRPRAVQHELLLGRRHCCAPTAPTGGR